LLILHNTFVLSQNTWQYPVTPYTPGSYAGRSFYFDNNHLGEDIELTEGTPIRSIGSGVIKYYSAASSYGELVVAIEHDLGKTHTFKNAYNNNVNTRYILSIYGHLRKSSQRGGGNETGLNVGDTVQDGTVIGYVNNSSHPDYGNPDPNGDGLEHLHMGIRLSNASTAQNNDGSYWLRGYEQSSNAGNDFAAASKVIEILIGSNNPTDEIFVKGSSNKIYLLKNNILHWITDHDNIYLPMTAIYGNLQNVSDSELAQYYWGSLIIGDGLICKHQTDSKIYLIQYDQKRHFINESAYTQRGYKLQGGDPISPTVINLPDGMLNSYPAGPTITTSNVNVQADLYFKKGNQRTNSFEPGDMKSTFIELKAGDGYTSFYYLRVTNPDGSQYYASYSNSSVIPNTPFTSSPNKVPLLRENGIPKTYNIVPGNWNNPWNFNNYTLPTTTAPGTYKWEYWYEDVNKPGIILCKDTESYTVQSAQNEITVTFQSVPSGRIIKIDNQNYTTPKSFTWNVGSSHIVSTDQTQMAGSDTKYIFTQWSDGAARTHAITASASIPSYTAYFATNYLLTSSTLPADAGNVSPTSGWYSSGTTLQLSAQPAANTNYSFSYWSGDLTGNQNPTPLIMDAPKTVTANFINIPPKQITVTTSPTGLPILVDGAQYTAPSFFKWNVGERHTISVNEIEPKSTGERLLFESWSDGGGRNHEITVPATNAIYNANFVTEYQLTTVNNPVNSGTINITPLGEWFISGTNVNLQAQANTDYSFSHWSGDGSGSSNPYSVRMNAPKNIIANYQSTGGDVVLVRFPTGLKSTSGSQIEIPILILTDVTGMSVISYKLILNYNGNVLNATGVNRAGTMTESWQDAQVNTTASGQIQVAGYGTSELTGTGTLVKIVFDVIGSHGTQSNLEIDKLTFNSGSPEADVQAGIFIVEEDKPDISGYVYYYDSTEPVPYVNMSIIGGGSAEMTKNDGSYQFLNLTPGANYLVTPTMNRFNHIKSNCIHASDASLAAKASFGMSLLNSNQQKAADVDRNGTVQMYDAALILYYAVVGPPLSSDSHVGEWEFDPANRSYSNLTSNKTNQNYEAIVLGDVNADWPNPPLLAKADVNLISLGDPVQVQPGGDFLFKLPVNTSQQILTAFVKINYDPTIVSLNRVSKTSQSQNFIFYEKEEKGSLVCGLLAEKPKVISDGLLEFYFTAKEKQESTAIDIVDFSINGEAAQNCKQNISIGNKFNKIESFTLFQNYPNPFNPETTVRYTLGWREPKLTIINVYDVTGKLIKRLSKNYQTSGEFEVRWDGINDDNVEVPSGVYICSIRSGLIIQNIKMLKIK